jgi:hypothetical protein
MSLDINGMYKSPEEIQRQRNKLNEIFDKDNSQEKLPKYSDYISDLEADIRKLVKQIVEIDDYYFVDSTYHYPRKYEVTAKYLDRLLEKDKRNQVSERQKNQDKENYEDDIKEILNGIVSEAYGKEINLYEEKEKKAKNPDNFEEQLKKLIKNDVVLLGQHQKIPPWNNVISLLNENLQELIKELVLINKTYFEDSREGDRDKRVNEFAAVKRYLKLDREEHPDPYIKWRE